MNEKLIKIITEGGIEIVIGIYLVLMSYRVVGKEPGEDSKYDTFMKEKGNLLKFGGIAIIIFGIVMVIKNLFS